MSTRKKYTLLLLISGIIFYILNYLTPLFSDDWHYNFIYGTLDKIDNISDVIKSQYIHYFKCNGRFIPHFIIQLFDGILGKELFNVFNTIAFILFIHLSTHLVKNEYKALYLPAFLILLLCFYFIPSFNNCFLWMSGACNYLWVADILLIFNILLFKQIKEKIYYPLLFIIGMISGWTNEAFIIGMSCGYFVYFIIKRIKPTLPQTILLSGFYIGTILLVFSPGSIHRALGNNNTPLNITAILHNLINSFLNMNNIRLLPLLIILFLYSTYKKKINPKQFIGDNIIWIIAIIVSFIFVLFTNYNSGHSRFGFEFFSLLLTVKLLSNFNINKYFIQVLHFFLAITAIYIIKLSYTNYHEYQNCINQINQSDNSIILTNEMKYPNYFERFIIRFITKSSEANIHFTDTWIANRFKKDSLVFIPETLYTEITKSPEKFNNVFYTTDDFPFYVMQNNEKKILSVTFILRKTNYKKLPFYIKPIAHKLKRYTADTITSNLFNTINISNSNYIFVNKNSIIKDRILHIKINNTNYNIVEAQ